VADIDAVISGHTIVETGYQVWGNCFYIDGGAFLDKPLTILSDEDVAKELKRFGSFTYNDHHDFMLSRLDAEWDERMANSKPQLRPTNEECKD
jgi:hypothetical protein